MKRRTTLVRSDRAHDSASPRRRRCERRRATNCADDTNEEWRMSAFVFRQSPLLSPLRLCNASDENPRHLRGFCRAPACGVRATCRRFGLRRSRAGRVACDVLLWPIFEQEEREETESNYDVSPLLPPFPPVQTKGPQAGNALAAWAGAAPPQTKAATSRTHSITLALSAITHTRATPFYGQSPLIAASSRCASAF